MNPSERDSAVTGAASRPLQGNPVLEMRGVRVLRRGRLALDLGNLAVDPGERVAIVGPNGAGKTTLLHAAALLAEPDAGEIAFAGERVAARNRERLRREVAIVLQQPALFRGSALDNAALGLRLRGAGPGAARTAGRAWLERFGIGGLADRKPGTLSGGEAQRVALARAFAVEPRLLLLDEPFSSLDAASRASLLPDLAGALASSGASAVLVTHDLREAAAFGERLGVLLDGKLAQIGPPGEALARPVSLAAARVLGVENLLPGVALRDGEGWAIRLDPGSVGAPGGASPDGLVIRAGSAAPGVAAGARCWLAVRAGAIRLECGSPSGSVPAIVRASEATPDGWRVTLAGDAPLIVHRGWGAPPSGVGEPARAMIPPERAHLVPESPAP